MSKFFSSLIFISMLLTSACSTQQTNPTTQSDAQPDMEIVTTIPPTLKETDLVSTVTLAPMETHLPSLTSNMEIKPTVTEMSTEVPTLQPTNTTAPTETFTPVPTTPKLIEVPETLQQYQLVYADNSGVIHLVLSDGRADTPISDSKSWFESPTWSPDGRIIAMVGQGDNGPAIFTMRPDGSNLKKLNEPKSDMRSQFGYLRHLLWAPDGGRLSFIADSSIDIGKPSNNIITSLGGGLTSRHHSQYTAWSPSGDQLTFTAGSDSEMYLAASNNRFNSGVILTDFTNPAVVQVSTWSPDGNSVAFMMNLGESLDLYLVDIVNLYYPENQRLLYSSPISKTYPTWSPNGDWIAFVSDGDIEAIRPDGTGWHAIVSDLPGEIYNLVWSPDSTRLAFILEENSQINLYVIQADGVDQKQLAVDLRKTGKDSQPIPSWSPFPVEP